MIRTRDIDQNVRNNSLSKFPRMSRKICAFLTLCFCSQEVRMANLPEQSWALVANNAIWKSSGSITETLNFLAYIYCKNNSNWVQTLQWRLWTKARENTLRNCTCDLGWEIPQFFWPIHCCIIWYFQYITQKYYSFNTNADFPRTVRCW